MFFEGTQNSHISTIHIFHITLPCFASFALKKGDTLYTNTQATYYIHAWLLLLL